MKKIVFILVMLFSLVSVCYAASFQYDIDGEGGTDGQVATGTGGFEGWTTVKNTVTFNDTHTAGQAGSMEFALQYLVGTEGHNETRAEETFSNGTYVIQAGDTIYLGADVYVEAGFDWGQQTTSAANVIKFMRIGVNRSSDTDWGGYWSIFWNTDSDGRPYASLEPANSSYFKDTNTFASIVDNTWTRIDMAINIQSDATGFVSLTSAGVNKVQSGIQTSFASRIGSSIPKILIGSTWNGNVPATQNMYVNNVYFGLNIPPGGVEANPGNDVTAPIVSVVTPSDGATGVSIGTDIEINATDAGDGLDVNTFRMSSNELTFSLSDLTRTGTTANSTWTLDNVFISDDVTWSDNVTVSAGVTDLNSNTSLTQTFSFQIQTEPVVGTTFGTGDENDISNWTQKTTSPDRWEVFTLNNEDVLFLNDSSYVPDGAALGEYIIYQNDVCQDVEIELEARSAEDFATNGAPDLAIVIGYVDDINYTFCLLNADSSSNGVFPLNSGDREDNFTTSVNLRENEWISFKVRAEDGAINVFRKYSDDEWVSVFRESGLNYKKGKVGVGGFNDSAYFRNVKVTCLDDTVVYSNSNL